MPAKAPSASAHAHAQSLFAVLCGGWFQSSEIAAFAPYCARDRSKNRTALRPLARLSSIMQAPPDLGLRGEVYCPEFYRIFIPAAAGL
jgi:hypothetical protein